MALPVNRVLWILLSFPLLTCGKKARTEFRGRWTATDGPSFEPCGAAEKWLVTLGSTVPVETSMVFVETHPGSSTPPVTDTQAPLPLMFAIVRGDTSAPTDRSAFRRHLVVRDIVEMRPFKTGDCP